jgi:hypothetical protein
MVAIYRECGSNAKEKSPGLGDFDGTDLPMILTLIALSLEERGSG